MKNIPIGTLIKLGNHRLIRGDAKDPETIKKLLGDNQVDLIACDPPYGVFVVESRVGFSENKKSFRPIENDHDQSDGEYEKFTTDWINAVKPYLAKKNSLYIFNSDKKIFALRNGMLRAGCYFSQLLIWAKTHAIIGRLDYLPQHELIAYGWVGTHKFLRSKDKSILVYPGTKKNTLHPTMKPLGLMRKLILNSTKINDIIYDPFGGSGSTLLASEQTKRKCFMVELDEDYCNVIISRFEKLTSIRSEIVM